MSRHPEIEENELERLAGRRTNRSTAAPQPRSGFLSPRFFPARSISLFSFLPSLFLPFIIFVTQFEESDATAAAIDPYRRGRTDGRTEGKERIIARRDADRCVSLS